MSDFVYADMKARIHQTQQRRGLIRVYAFTRLARHVRVMRVGVVCIVRELLHIMRESATAQPRNYPCMVRVVVLRTRATAQPGFHGHGRAPAQSCGSDEEPEDAEQRAGVGLFPPADHGFHLRH